MRRRDMAMLVGALSAVALLAMPVGAAEILKDPGKVLPGVRTEAGFLNDLVDLDALPRLTAGVKCQQFSSYDRASRYDEATGEYLDWGANGDWGKYLREEGNVGVMAEMEGPGCIYRIWSANPQGRIQFFFDGEQEPRVDMEFARMFDDSTPPFLSPLCGIHGRGQNSYLPMPFQKSCRVLSIGEAEPPRHYYHITYTTFPEGARVQTFSPDFDAATRATLENVRGRLNGAGQDPQPTDRCETARANLRLQPGSAPDAIVLNGPAEIKQLLARVDPQDLDTLRDVILQVYWDDAKRPSVDAPLGDFFGTAPGVNVYRSLPLGMTESLFYCYWRMPFLTKARIVLVNAGDRPAHVALEARYAPTPQLMPYASARLPREIGYFHAKWRREAPSHTFDYPFLEATGWGKYLGVVMNVQNLDTGWWGEGDEKVYIDGEKFPSTFGTGSEDYFGDAWGHRHFVHAFHGNTKGQGPGFSNKWSVYRWHIGDNIPFEESFKITIENYRDGGDNVDYSSTAYWYATLDTTDFFPSVAAVDRKPWAYSLERCAEIEDAAGADAPGVQMLRSRELPQEACGGYAVAIGAPGLSRALDVRLDAPLEGTYNLELRYLKAPDAPTFEVRQNGNAVGAAVDAYAPEPTFVGPEKVGSLSLLAGGNTVTLAVTGRNEASRGSRLVLDAYRLMPVIAENAIEGERLRVVKAEHGPAGEQRLTPIAAGAWSNDSHMWYRPDRAPAEMILVLPVAEEGDYDVSVFLTKAIDYGIVQVAMDGEDIGQPFDGFNDGVIPSGRVRLGRAHLTKGDHQVTFRVTGKNEKSIGYMAGVDCITLDPVP